VSDAWITVGVAISPSPRELYARLSDEEKIAVDLLLEEGDERDTRLLALVADPARRALLRGLAKQLVALGFSVHESPELDREVVLWKEARRRSAEWSAARDREDEEAREQDRRWLDTLTPEIRQSVERQRRKRAARRHRR
jgi:hypothetical protein